MFSHRQLSKKPKAFLSYTGVTRQQFDVILKDVRKNHRITEKKRLSEGKRERGIGAGRKFDLDLKDRLVMLLVYYRMYLTCDLTGHLFGLDQSNVCRNIQYLEPAVKQSVPIPSKLYSDSKKISSLQEMLQFFPEFIAITDGTEQPIPRPKKQEEKKITLFRKKEKTYSKKPNHDKPKRSDNTQATAFPWTKK